MYRPTKKIIGYFGILSNCNSNELYLALTGAADKSTCICCKNYIKAKTSVAKCNTYKAMNGNNAVNVIKNKGQIKWYFDHISTCQHK